MTNRSATGLYRLPGFFSPALRFPIFQPPPARNDRDGICLTIREIHKKCYSFFNDAAIFANNCLTLVGLNQAKYE